MPLKPRIVILISGRGTNMEAIAQACRDGELSAEILFVGSDRPEAGGLETAKSFGIPTQVFFYKRDGRQAAEEALAKSIEESKCDWIVLAGFMRILSPEFVHRFSGRIINIHPAILPSFPGAHGIQDAWDYGVKLTGVTVHIVDDQVDHGPILAQECVRREPEDTIETLEAKIHQVEHKIYKKTLKDLFAKHPIN